MQKIKNYAKMRKIQLILLFNMYFSRYFKHLFGILGWIMSLFLVVILYHYSVRYMHWTPKVLGHIETAYHVIEFFLVGGFVWSIVGTIFYQIRHSRAIETKLIRRFLPIFQFIINTIIVMLVGFFMLEALGINTRNILTGAGIGGAIFVLAYKDLFTNLLGSLSILLSKTFEIGDTIRVRTLRLWIEGMVEEITLNHTKITNKTGEVVYVPNKVIYSESVENLSRRRFYSYELLVPFAKTTPSEEISRALRVIEGKINSFFPIDVEYTMSNTNATDYTYTITVLLPEENNFFETEMRMFLVQYIFGRGGPATKHAENSPKEIPPVMEEVSEDDL